MTDEEFIRAIEHVLFEKNFEAVFLNPTDYTAHMGAFSRKRFEPNTHVTHLRAGWVGTYGYFDEPGYYCQPKFVYVRREVPEGAVLGAMLPTTNQPGIEPLVKWPVLDRETHEALFPKSEWHEIQTSPWVKDR